MLTIGQLARRLGISSFTLKRWEERGEIPKPRRTIGGWRIYSEEEASRLELLLNNKETTGQRQK